MPRGIYKRKPRTPEHCANLSKASRNSDAVKAYHDSQKDVPKSPEHCAAITKGMKNSDAVKADAEARKGVPRTPETRAAISKAHEGVLLSPEHSAAISKALTGIPHTPEHIAATIKGCEEAGVYEAMKGGNDLVTHHYIYDESDLSKNTVKMTRSDHMRLHRLLQKLGYVIPHVNVTGEDSSEARAEVL